MRRSEQADHGFTLIEILIVIVILGILAVVVVFSVRGVTDRGQDNACQTDERTIAVAVESYFAQEGGVGLSPTGPVDGEEYERTLVDYGVLRDTSEYWNVESDGAVVNVAPC